ncbi:MAG: nucleotidyltransferase family protein [Ferroplasma sp.]|uniref:nucleotidyltransferase family protein n=1 Tax=Ferroplasma sp. TaxID=2591003 RepID=UPI002815177D|nr:nucleotidyltransferase family protein [Ferroplasma sp.]WMT50673.1 MAG: nucleotidyltransferase family protein [Ferroplasma sp.]
MSHISAVITASGMAERFGSDKLMYIVNSIPIIHYTMENVLKAGFYERLIVLRNSELKQYAVNHGFIPVWNDEYKKGMSQSIILGIKNVSENSDAAMIIPGDLPMMPSDYLNSLISHFNTHGKGIAGFLMHGSPVSPVIFSRKYFKELLDLNGDRGGKPVIKRHMDDFTGMEAPDDSLMDIDTLDDARAFEKIIHKS